MCEESSQVATGQQLRDRAKQKYANRGQVTFKSWMRNTAGCRQIPPSPPLDIL